MRQLPKIRTLISQDWEAYKKLRMQSLADSPNAFGRILAEEEKRTDASWINRLMGDGSSLNLPLVAEIEGEPIGLAWGRIEHSNPDVANLYQLWVYPSHRGGVGKLLVEEVIAWAKEKNAIYLDLGVTLRESPAMRLYTRLEFEALGEPHPLRVGSEILSLPVTHHTGATSAATSWVSTVAGSTPATMTSGSGVGVEVGKGAAFG
ncbi:MAG: GNAT family N-acetyltransferase [Anaerolineae bacterium]|jgi:GNAT superfamily N-acetyltransferase|nr:GNAT family N-acetyltransferase [Anaerolineae bacterium]MBT3712750.1 GNAT family N-acetyltransferase [Anaerolineae bacterium]MBT4309999.1 GNAT family N-acetyltransferase [Anaerolineae bacterium]MBT4458022.1 GNAT family N-acetyltransferase [Anaerolineae bacterium]MBT6060873.1 GNAT family N-acetyltransferase [Anaerolineae bacterium]